ncbi:UNVERIFIED_CONTAM: hypothetical protein GTU68_059922 [Idotea baltica]|nr:hypothetical protein [Idotea baltica]
MIPFHIPYISGNELLFVKDAMTKRTFSGGGYYTKACEDWLENYTKANKILLTSSCTHSLEMCALLCNIQPGDEVIMTSFNFVSAANAFVLRGAKIVFVDVDPVSMNIDEGLIPAAISSRTKAIVVMHYGGIACNMDVIMDLAEKAGVWVVEDAAHCIGAFYKGQHLGTIGHMGTLSFHATKNIHCGEGGALLINDGRFIAQAEIIREKGTNRNAFLRGEIDRYTWKSIGSSYLMNELSAAFLYGQLKHLELVNKKRTKLKNLYVQELCGLQDFISLPPDSDENQGNCHLFFIKVKEKGKRDTLIENLASNWSIQTAFHYLPLHSTEIGVEKGCFLGNDRYTTLGSEAIVRLPLYFDLQEQEVEEISKALRNEFLKA